MSRRLTFLFALAAGAAIANLYWAQPLLGVIAGDLHAATATAGWLVTAAQVGYAAGVLLLVPLGDVVDRRRFVPVMLLTSAAALLLCALAPSIGALLLALGVLGVTTVSGQVLTPLAGDLAGDADRGRIVGVVGSGTLTGILASRTISGSVAGAAGWRTVFALAAVVAVVLALLLYRTIPPRPPRTPVPYVRLIASVGTVVLRERAARWTLVLAATGFATFSLFWTALTFLLSGPPFQYPVSVIGLFGLAGLAGILSGLHGGRLHDRGWSIPATGAAWTLALAAFAVAAFAGRSVVLVIVAIVMIDVALQTQALLNRARLFALSHGARSRLNTALATSNFIGAAAGSAAATTLWSAGGWPAVTTAGTALCCLALTVWALGRRGPLLCRVSDVRRGVMLYGHGVEAVAEALRELDPRYALVDRVVPDPGQVSVLRFRHAAEADAAREAEPDVAWLVVELDQPAGEAEHAREPLLRLNAAKVDPATAARAIDQPDLVVWFGVVHPVRVTTVDGGPAADDCSNLENGGGRVAGSGHRRSLTRRSPGVSVCGVAR